MAFKDIGNNLSGSEYSKNRRFSKNTYKYQKKNENVSSQVDSENMS